MFRDMVLPDTIEAAQIGGAAGLSPEDLIYAQYREAGVLVQRGFIVSKFVN